MKHPGRTIWVLAVLLLLVMFFSLFLGRYPTPFWLSPLQIATDPLAAALVWDFRLPRILLAVLLGAALSTAGFAMQMVFRNPLVEPGFLGVSQGAAFGSALTIVAFGGSLALAEGLAALFAILGLLLSYLFARAIRYGGWVLRLVLAGIAVSALFAAGVGMLKFVADPLRQLPEIVFWLLGGLSGARWEQVWYVLPFALIGLLVLFLLRWRLNLLSLDDATAFSLGVHPGRERWLVLLAAVLPVAALVSVSGIVGWVGLIVPHFSRRLVGANARWALPVAMLLGAIFVLLCDDLARTVLAGEIPLGILTSLVGALLFLWLFVRFTPRERKAA